MGGRALVLVVGAAVALGVAEREAEADSCTPLTRLVAPVADTHPLGASLVFAISCHDGLKWWVATVDGEPATLVDTEEGYGITIVDLEPPPGLGAEVELYEDCSGALDSDECGELVVEHRRFVIGPVDEEAPPPADPLELHQVHDDEGVTFSAVIRFPSVEPGTYADVWFDRADEALSSESREIPANGELSVSDFYADPEWIEGDKICVGVEVSDASGNRSKAELECTIASAASEGGCAVAAGPRWTALALLVLVRRRRRR